MIAALDYASRGWPVLPLAPGGKEPHGRLVRHGHLDASTDPERVRRWWKAEPGANLGVVCGPSSFDALDVDGPEGMESLRRFVSLHGRIVTWTHKTPNGYHMLFKPSGLPCGAKRIAPGVDTKGSGNGYVVAPPSVLVDGGTYREAVRADLAEAPSWLVEQARALKPISRTLGESVELVSKAAEGHRNATLNTAVFIASKDADSDTEAVNAAARLVAASTLTRVEAERTGRSAFVAGLEVGARRRKRFRRVPIMLVLDPRFQSRSADAKLVAYVICAGPDATAIPGVSVASLEALARSASLSKDRTTKALRELAFARFLRSDLRAGLFWIPSVTEKFEPEAPSVTKAWRNALDAALPTCRLRDEIAKALAAQLPDRKPVPSAGGC